MTIKLSVNHYLLDHDPDLLDLAGLLRDAMKQLAGDRMLVLNVRLRRGPADDDQAVVAAVRAAGLLDLANVFYLQRYGFAAKRTDWEEPFVVGTNFTLVNPDGSSQGTDLVQRSEAMRALS